jgi:hypothetical protein
MAGWNFINKSVVTKIQNVKWYVCQYIPDFLADTVHAYQVFSPQKFSEFSEQPMHKGECTTELLHTLNKWQYTATSCRLYGVDTCHIFITQSSQFMCICISPLYNQCENNGYKRSLHLNPADTDSELDGTSVNVDEDSNDFMW